MTANSSALPGLRGPEQHPVGVYLAGKIMLGLMLMFLSAVIAVQNPAGTYAPQGAFYLVAVAFAVWGASAAALRQAEDLVRYGWYQLIFDAVLVTALVAVTSGVESPLTVLYFINIIAAPFVVPGWGVGLVLLLDVVGFAGVAWGGHVGLFPWLAASHATVDLQALLLQVFGMALVGMLSIQLTRAMTGILQEQVAQGRALQAERAMILSELDVGLAVLDEDGRVVELNPVLESLLDDVRGQRLSELLPGAGDTWEVPLELEDEEPLRLLCSRRRRGAGGELVLVQDVTWLRKMEEVVAREERLAAVGKLAAGLAHEIRNPLASLSGSIQLLQDETPGPLHGIALREVERLNGLVEDFLDAARPPRIEIRPVDVPELVAEVITTFRNDARYRARLKVEEDLTTELPRVPLDPERFRQVLWNLLLNAAQATPGAGTIAVILRRRPAHLELRVTDSGVGIRAEQIRNIFDPFFTTRSGGTGLGLANVDRIVRGHGGSISVYSKPGQGTTFMLAFPLADADVKMRPGAGLDRGSDEVIEVDG